MAQPEPSNLTIIRFSIDSFVMRADDEASDNNELARWFMAGWPSARVMPGMTWPFAYRHYIRHAEAIIYPGDAIYLMQHGKPLNRDGTER